MSDISAIYARFAVEAIERRAIDLESIFTGTSLNLERLRTQDSISINDFVTLLTNSRRLSNDDSIGLEIARRVQLPVLGQVSPAMTAAPTIRSGLQLLERYVRLLATYIEIELESLPEVLQVRIHFLKDLGPEVERFHAESSIANVQRYVELILGDHLRNACCLFKFPEPDYSERYREIYHSPCRFGQPNHAIELPHDLADKLSPFFESTTWVDSQSKLAKQLRQMQNHGRQSYEQHVKAFLKSQVPPHTGSRINCGALRLIRANLKSQAPRRKHVL